MVKAFLNTSTIAIIVISKLELCHKAKSKLYYKVKIISALMQFIIMKIKRTSKLITKKYGIMV